MELIKKSVFYAQRLAQESLIALLARVGLAATFWLSGQSKVEGFTLDILGGSPLAWGIPRLTRGTIALFADEYRLPLLPPDIAALLAATAEHLFPVLLLFGFATRLSALALMAMTLAIQIFVYPDAWPVHATWLTAQLYLLAYGGGRFSIDHRLSYRRRKAA